MGPGCASLLLLLLGCLAAPLAAAARTPLQLRRLVAEAQEQPVPAEFVVTNDTLSALLERTSSPGKAVIFTTTRHAGRKGLRRPGSVGGSAGDGQAALGAAQARSPSCSPLSCQLFCPASD